MSSRHTLSSSDHDDKTESKSSPPPVVATPIIMPQRRIEELRVAYQELTTKSERSTSVPLQSTLNDNKHGDGRRNDNYDDNNNRVFLQLSPGSVAIRMDRNVAEARVSRQLLQQARAMDEYRKQDGE